MTTFTTTIEIKAPPPRVWAVLADVEGWPDWTASVTSVERLDSGPLVVGSRARLRQPKLRPAIWQVTKIEKGHSFTWTTRSAGLVVTGHHVVDAAKKGNASRVTLTIEFAGLLGGLVAWLTRGLNKHYLALEAAGLKKRSEQEARPAGDPPL
jgi:uncharacterized protein YndB with AHSA1/START domain